MEFIFGFIIFILACYISFYLPGKFILSYVFPKLRQQAVSLLSLPIGIAIFIFLSYIGAWSHIYYLPLGVIIGTILFGYFYNKNRKNRYMEFGNYTSRLTCFFLAYCFVIYTNNFGFGIYWNHQCC